MIYRNVLIGIFLVCILSCKKSTVPQKKECDSEIEYVQVGFVLGDLLFASDVSCIDFKAIAKGASDENIKDGDRKLYQEKNIEDCSVLKTINESLKKTTFDTSKMQSIDVRMKCIIKYKSKKSDTLCISGMENKVMLNGCLINNTDSLIYTIRKAVHYYRYYPAEAYPHFHEIKKFEYGGK